MLKKMKTLLAVAVLSGTVSANVQAETVTVQEGDTLWELSQVHNTSVETFKKENDLTTDIIHPGDVLTLEQKKHYTVKQGETLWDIAREHHVSVEQLKNWNKLDKDTIQPGVELLLLLDEKNTEKVEPQKPATTAPVKKTVPAKAKPKTKAQKPAKKVVAKSKKKPKVITVKATAYTAYCKGCSGITKTGINLKANPNKKVIAVDPKVIPLGSKVHVEGYGKAIAADIGGAIKGKRIDVFIPNNKRAIKFGVKKLKVTIID